MLKQLEARVSEADYYRWVILTILFFIQATTSMFAFSFGPLAPFLQSELGITRAQIGMLSSAIYLGMFLFSTHAGWLTDKYSIRFFLLLGPGVMGLLLLTMLLANSYMLIILIVFMCGVGYQFVNPTTVKSIILWFPPKLRGTAVGVKQGGISFGGAVAAVILPVIALSWGWRAGIVVISAAILITVIVCFIFYREPFDKDISKKNTSAGFKEIARTITNRNVLLQSVVGMLYSIAVIAFSTYLVLYLHEVMSISGFLAGMCLMIAQFGMAAGRVLWGVISDRLFEGRRKGTIILCGVFITALALIMILLAPLTPYWLVVVVSALFGLALGFHGVHTTFLGELGKEMAATSVGFGAAVYALGVVIGTPIFGIIVDNTGSYHMAWLFLAILSFTGIILTTLIKE